MVLIQTVKRNILPHSEGKKTTIASGSEPIKSAFPEASGVDGRWVWLHHWVLWNTRRFRGSYVRV